MRPQARQADSLMLSIELIEHCEALLQGLPRAGCLPDDREDAFVESAGRRVIRARVGQLYLMHHGADVR